MGAFIVAELSANHNQDLNLAIESIHAIKECGADAVKLQTYTPESLTIDCKSEIFRVNAALWRGEYLYDLYKKAYMPLEWNAELFAQARKIGLMCFSSAFDKMGVDLLESLGNPIYKIASFEITDIALITYAASKNKPIILSNGVAMGDEMREAVEAIRGCNPRAEITILECASSYPANLGDINFARMRHSAEFYGVKCGLSDHTLGTEAASVAVSLGASVIEKHFILDKKRGGVDSGFSADRAEFTHFVKILRECASALNGYVRVSNNAGDSANGADSGAKDSVRDSAIDSTDSAKSREIPKGREFARSLFVVKNIKKGEILSDENIRAIRPNAGLPPKYLPLILGKKATQNLTFGKPLQWDDFA